jgi:hypothetical protein
VQEHDGRAITGSTDIAPFSVSQYIAQSFGAQTDRRGSATLGALDGKLPFTLNTDTTGARKVYNIVPTSKLSTQPTQDVFVGRAAGLHRHADHPALRLRRRLRLRQHHQPHAHVLTRTPEEALIP